MSGMTPPKQSPLSPSERPQQAHREVSTPTESRSAMNRPAVCFLPAFSAAC